MHARAKLRDHRAAAARQVLTGCGGEPAGSSPGPRPRLNGRRSSVEAPSRTVAPTGAPGDTPAPAAGVSARADPAEARGPCRPRGHRALSDVWGTHDRSQVVGAHTAARRWLGHTTAPDERQRTRRRSRLAVTGLSGLGEDGRARSPPSSPRPGRFAARSPQPGDSPGPKRRSGQCQS